MSTPSAPSRPPLPALGLPAPRRRFGVGAAVAVAAHVALIAALVWERTRYLEGALGDDGPAGGGGRGAGEQLNYVALPAAAGPRAAPPPPEPEVAEPLPRVVPLPEPLRIEIAPVAINPLTVTVSGVSPVPAGGAGPAGSGDGTGGGAGAGAGPGAGPGSGGGEGGDIIPPDPIGIFLPPTCVSGAVIAVVFFVEATGRVSRVEVDPPPKEASCRRELLEKLGLFRFKPARTRDGRPVAARYPGWIGK